MFRIFLILSFLLALIAETRQHFFRKSEQQIISHAQLQLNKLENEIQQSLTTILSFDHPEQFHEFFIHHPESDRKSENPQELGFSFFYYQNEKLLFWSDNEVPLSNIDSVKNGAIL